MTMTIKHRITIAKAVIADVGLPCSIDKGSPIRTPAAVTSWRMRSARSFELEFDALRLGCADKIPPSPRATSIICPAWARLQRCGPGLSAVSLKVAINAVAFQVARPHSTPRLPFNRTELSIERPVRVGVNGRGSELAEARHLISASLSLRCRVWQVRRPRQPRASQPPLTSGHPQNTHERCAWLQSLGSQCRSPEVTRLLPT